MLWRRGGGRGGHTQDPHAPGPFRTLSLVCRTGRCYPPYGPITTGTRDQGPRLPTTEPTMRCMARDELPTTIPTVSPGWPSRTADLVAVAFCLLANAATARLVGRAREALQPKIGTAHAALVPLRHRPARRLATILITLALFGIGLTKLLVGGAFATVLDRHRRSAEPLQLVRGDGPHARPAGPRRGPSVDQVRASRR
jgi:hypothetical protein